MTVKLPYKKYPSVWTGTDEAAVLNVQLAREAKNAPRTKRFEAIIDSGAARCFFHSDIGAAAGFDIRTGTLREMIGVSGKSTPVYVHKILLYVPGGAVSIEAAFSDDLPVAGLLGMKGFFDHFKVTFNAAAHMCELDRIYHA